MIISNTGICNIQNIKSNKLDLEDTDTCFNIDIHDNFITINVYNICIFMIVVTTIQ